MYSWPNTNPTSAVTNPTTRSILNCETHLASQVLVPPSMKHSSMFQQYVRGEPYQCCSHPTHSRQQYRDYIINLYGVKHSTVNNTKYAMPSLSCLLSFYTIPFLIQRIFHSFFLYKVLPYFVMSIKHCIQYMYNTTTVTPHLQIKFKSL